MKLRGRGFTLIEVFIASIFVAVILFAIMTLYPAGMSAMKRAQAQIIASNLAQADLETVRGLSFDDPQLISGSTLQNVDGIVFTVSRDVTVVTPDVKQVIDKVVWDSGPNAGFASLTYSTCIYRFVNLP